MSNYKPFHFTKGQLREVATSLFTLLPAKHGFDPEKLINDAMAFYRWYFAQVCGDRILEEHRKVFKLQRPKIEFELMNPYLWEATFITWFIANDFHKRDIDAFDIIPFL